MTNDISDEMTKASLGMIVSKMIAEAREAKLRLYGVLWLLVEQEIISTGKATELGKKPLHEMIGECLRWQEESLHKPLDAGK